MTTHLRADLSFEAAKTIKAALEADVRRLGDVVRAMGDAAPRGPMNLAAEHIRLSPEYREAKARFDAAFARLGNFNGAFVRRFKAELRAERKDRRA